MFGDGPKSGPGRAAEECPATDIVANVSHSFPLEEAAC
jgi:hypothetical protein